MTGLGDLVQKAFYLGVGMASYAAEKAGVTLQELRTQAQKVADEMVARGEMTTEEARKYVDEMMRQAQQATEEVPPKSSSSQSKEPRLIEIVSDDDEEKASTSQPENRDQLRQQVELLQEELRRLKRQ